MLQDLIRFYKGKKMKTLTNLGLTASLVLIGMQQAVAGPVFGPVVSTPEISASSAVLGLGLMAGLVAFISERRKK